jgi:hypothetical protein
LQAVKNPLASYTRKRGKIMSIKSVKMTLEKAMEAYYNEIRDNIVSTLVESLNGIGLKIDDTMTYKKIGILTEEAQEAASEAELTAHDKAFDEVDKAFDEAAEAVYMMLKETGIDEWCEVETHHYCDNTLKLEIKFDGMEYSFTIGHRS